MYFVNTNLPEKRVQVLLFEKVNYQPISQMFLRNQIFVKFLSYFTFGNKSTKTCECQPDDSHRKDPEKLSVFLQKYQL